MTWWIMKVSHETSSQHQQWPSKKHLDDCISERVVLAKLDGNQKGDLQIPVQTRTQIQA